MTDKNNMLKNNVTLQINSLDALEKLIGGDSQIEIDIRNSTAYAFTKKHIKNFIDDNFAAKIASDIKRELSQDFKTEIQNLFGWYRDEQYLTRFKLNDEMKKMVSEAVLNVAKETVQNYIKEYLENLSKDKSPLLQDAKKHISVFVGKIIQDNCNAVIPGLVKKMINDELSNFSLKLIEKNNFETNED